MKNLNIASWFALIIGALGSMIMMLYTGRYNDSTILIFLFSAWILSPFILMIIAKINSKRKSSFSRVILYILIVLFSIGSLISYGGFLTPADFKPAFIYLITPLFS